MAIILLLVALFLYPLEDPWAGSALYQYGTCSYYNEGILERVAEYRGLSCDNCIGYMTYVQNCDRIGAQTWVYIGGKLLGPLLVVDCGKEENYPALRANRRIAEMDVSVWLDLDLPNRPVECMLIERSN